MPSEWENTEYPEYLEVDVWTNPDLGTYSKSITNQLFAYNPASNCWEWPSVWGDIPDPRFNHAMTVSGEFAILLGGEGIIGERLGYKNDLYILNLCDMEWIRAHRSMISKGIPRKRAEHSLTVVSPKSVVLFGGSKWRAGASSLIPSEDDYGYGDR